MQTPQDSLEKAHPFELSGLGVGPFRFVGMVSLPSPGLAEANPSAYNAALADLPRDLENGCGSCAHCGTPITNICIVQSADGRRHGIGSDCVLKTDDPYLGKSAKVAIARLQRQQRLARAQAKRAAAHEKYLASVCNERGETNAQRIEREQREEEERQEARKQAVWDKWGFVLPYLTGGGWCRSIAESIQSGWEPSGRAINILSEIYAKAHGRRNSEAYNAALEEFYKLIEVEIL